MDNEIRCGVFIPTCEGMLGLLLALDVVPWTNNSLEQHRREQVVETCAFIVFSTVLEAANVYAMWRVFFRPAGADVGREVLHCFANPSFLLLCGCVAAILLIKPIFALTEW